MAKLDAKDGQVGIRNGHLGSNRDQLGFAHQLNKIARQNCLAKRAATYFLQCLPVAVLLSSSMDIDGSTLVHSYITIRGFGAPGPRAPRWGCVLLCVAPCALDWQKKNALRWSARAPGAFFRSNWAVRRRLWLARASFWSARARFSRPKRLSFRCSCVRALVRSEHAAIVLRTH